MGNIFMKNNKILEKIREAYIKSNDAIKSRELNTINGKYHIDKNLFNEWVKVLEDIKDGKVDYNLKNKKGDINVWSKI